mmetsp:Transcript_35286/g.71299  ORF Transcript_35286/g.71299 Transcript_35286/m.71299 type:complete len:200 (-) Transcript_35286:54-653(-)
MRAFIRRNVKTIGFHASRASPSSVPYRTIWTLEPEPVELVKEGPRPHPDLQKLEALRLYREIIRTAKHFTWPDKDGIPFSEKLIKSARNEFEQARYEKDPELIARLLIGGREAMEKVTDRMAAKAHKIVQDEQRNAGQTSQAGMTFEQSNDLYWKQDFAQRHDNWVLQKEQANSNQQKDWAKLQQPGAQSPWKNWASKK